MAIEYQDRRIRQITAKQFLFFEGKFNWYDLEPGYVIKSEEFEVGDGKTSYLEVSKHARLRFIAIYLHNPKWLSNGSYDLSIRDYKNNFIHKEYVTTEQIIDMKIDMTPHDIIYIERSQYPIKITCTAQGKPCVSFRNTEFHLKQLSSDLKNHLEQSPGDVVLKVDDQEISCHKAILQARCPVFNRMFNYDSYESAVGAVEIDDISSSAMKKFINFLYTGAMDRCEYEDELFELYYAADKYEVMSLKNDCKAELVRHLSAFNVVAMFMLARRHNDEEFLEEVVKYIFNTFQEEYILKQMEGLNRQDIRFMELMYAKKNRNFNRE